MEDIHLFLAHACELEREAARRFEEMAAAMQTFGNAEVEAFFKKMAHYSRLHLADATERAGFRHPPKLEAHQYQWPDGESPEAAAWVGVDGFTDLAHALTIALNSEQRGHAFYQAIATTSTNPRVKAMAEEFAAEEAEHVAELERLMAKVLA